MKSRTGEDMGQLSAGQSKLFRVLEIVWQE